METLRKALLKVIGEPNAAVTFKRTNSIQTHPRSLTVRHRLATRDTGQPTFVLHHHTGQQCPDISSSHGAGRPAKSLQKHVIAVTNASGRPIDLGRPMARV